MYLHNDKELFEEVIISTAQALHMPVSIVEKDYFVTILLKAIAANQPDIVFKGGTSLSKCYKLINRFSEDIDLNLLCDTKPTEGQRKKLKSSIVSAAEQFEFSLVNSEDIRSRRDFNRYVIDYPTSFDSEYLKRQLIVETAVFFRSYPTERLNASSLIYDYLKNEHSDIVLEYSLEPFELNVQSAERTLIDKLYALGDYYLDNTINGHSRHIYDIYKLLTVVKLDEGLHQLETEVREERKQHKTCLSAQDNINMKALLSEIVGKGAYRADYENITSALLFEKLTYEEAVSALKSIIVDYYK